MYCIYIYIYIYRYIWLKNNLFKSTNIYLLFRSFALVELLKRREIFVLLSKLFF